MPLECAYWPVSRQARLAEHVGAAQNACRKSTPCSARPWSLGVGIGMAGSALLGLVPTCAPVADRDVVDGRPAAYVCRGFVCDRPVTDAADLRAALTAG